MHIGVNERLKNDNTNILIVKWVLVNTIMWVGITTNTFHNKNSIVIKKDHIQSSD